MTIQESLMVALLCMTIVMLVLFGLFLLIRIFSFAIEKLTKKGKGEKQKDVSAPATAPENTAGPDFSAGTLKLHQTDERTAAMIMAIVSDESGIPLSELCFKSIKSIGQKSDVIQEANI
ncbi:MAG: OadG family protein [Saccharofermentanales bacterium]